MICRSWCCTAAVEPSPNSRCSSLARCPSSAPKTSSTLAPKNSATTRALSVNARLHLARDLLELVADELGVDARSARAPAPARRPRSRPSTTRTGSSPASIRRSTNAAVAGSSTTTFSTITRPIEDVDAGMAKGCGGFHGEATVRAAPDGTQRASEAGEALGLLLVHVDLRDRRVPGPARTNVHQRVDRVRLALEDRLDRARRRCCAPSPRRRAARPPGASSRGRRLPAPARGR